MITQEQAVEFRDRLIKGRAAVNLVLTASYDNVLERVVGLGAAADSLRDLADEVEAAGEPVEEDDDSTENEKE